MNWKQISDIYMQEVRHQKPIPRDRAMLEYNYLKEGINLCLPEAFGNPRLLIDFDRNVLTKTLESSTIESNLNFRRSGDALEKVRDIINKYKNLPLLDTSLNARKKALSKEQITYCFAEFLKKNDMHNISTSILNTCEADVIAEKDDIHFFALSIGSPVRSTSSSIKAIDAATIFKTDFALSLLVLMEKMTSHPHITPSILISDDKTSHELIAPYQQVIKMGINIFLVTSVDKVELLEAD